MTTRILALVGSLRAVSDNQQAAKADDNFPPGGVEVETYECRADVAFCNEDLHQPGATPSPTDTLRKAASATGTLPMVTAEYNGTYCQAPMITVYWTSRGYPAERCSESLTVDMIAYRMYTVVSTMRTVHDDVEAGDPSTADLLHANIDDLEKQKRVLKAGNITRQPISRKSLKGGGRCV